jgi:plasmid stability protein
MKTTLDLPDDLVKEVKLRAVHEGRKLRDEVANLLRLGLAIANHPPARNTRLRSARVKTDRKSGLPVIVCRPNAPASKMSAAELIVLEQETQTQEDIERLGLSD